MSLLLLVTALALATDLDLAGLELEPPAGAHAVTARSPALYEAVVRPGLAGEARLTVYVVPAPPFSSQDAVRTRALAVAALYTDVLADWDEEQPPEGIQALLHGGDQERAARLAIVPGSGRVIGVLVDGSADAVAALEDELVATARTVREAGGPHPDGPRRVHLDSQNDYAMSVPHGFETETSQLEPLLSAHLPYHYGLPVALTVSTVTEALDRPLAEAAREIAAPAAGLSAGPPGSVSVRWEEAADETVRQVRWLVELGKRRFLVEAAAPADRYARYAAAFTDAVQSMRLIETDLSVDLAPRHLDSEAGFSFRPPAGFERRSRPGAIVAFEQVATLPPRNALVVRALPDAEPPADAAASRRLAEERIAAAGAEPLGTIVPKYLNGHLAARYALAAGDDPADAAELRWLIGFDRAVLEFAFETTRGELARHEETFDAALRTFSAVERTIAPDLDEPVTGADGDVSIRPPRGWEAVAADHVLLAFRPAEPGAAELLEVGVDAVPDPAPLSQVADQYRVQVISRLTAAGATDPRVEDAELRFRRGRMHLTMRVAYNQDGRPLRELLHAVRDDDRIVWARAVTSGSRFADHRALFEATTASLEVAAP